MEIGWQCHVKTKSIENYACITTFFAVAWSLWMGRNEVVFQQKEVDASVLHYVIKWRVAMWSKAWKEPIPYSVGELARNFTSIPELFR